jgi:hypothetical protein
VSVGRYAAIVVVGVATTMAAVLVALRGRLSAEDAVAVLLGAVLAASNSIAAYWLVAWSIGQSTVWFFRAILGGMLVRMTFMLTAVVAGILAVGLPSRPFVFSLLACFVALLALELVVVSRLVSRPAGRVEAA